MPGLFADAFVGFACLTSAEGDGWRDQCAVIDTVGPAGLERAKISGVHDIRNSIEALSLCDAAQEGFGRWPVASGINAPRAKHGAHGAHRIAFRDLVNGYASMDLLAKVQDFG